MARRRQSANANWLIFRLNGVKGTLNSIIKDLQLAHLSTDMPNHAQPHIAVDVVDAIINHIKVQQGVSK